MADLSTLDATQPPDTQLVALGAQRIRETRDATKTSFGDEHALTGEHKIPVGGPGSRPAAGHAGHLYINNSSNALEYDTGAAWVALLGFNTGLRGGREAGPTTIPNGSFVNLINISNFQMAQNGNIVIIGQFTVTYGTTIIGTRFDVDGTPDSTYIKTQVVPGASDIIMAMNMTFPIGAGSHVIHMQAEAVGGTHTAANIKLIAIPIY